MVDHEKLRKGIKRVAWGYFFIYFNLNIGSVSMTPAFVGYLFMLSAIGLLKSEVRDLELLPAMGRVLAAWHGFQWVASLFGQSLDGLWQFADILIGLVNIYFHFQLLTGTWNCFVTGRSRPWCLPGWRSSFGCARGSIRCGPWYRWGWCWYI
jgi:hypothetical protein